MLETWRNPKDLFKSGEIEYLHIIGMDKNYVVDIRFFDAMPNAQFTCDSYEFKRVKNYPLSRRIFKKIKEKKKR